LWERSQAAAVLKEEIMAAGPEIGIDWQSAAPEWRRLRIAIQY
jgi:hypothetical protein